MIELIFVVTKIVQHLRVVEEHLLAMASVVKLLYGLLDLLVQWLQAVGVYFVVQFVELVENLLPVSLLLL